MKTMLLDRTLSEPGTYLITNRGAQLRLRPVRLADGPALVKFFARVSPEELRFRFLDSSKHPADIAWMVGIDHRRTEHILVFDSATGDLIASLMLAADAQLDSAEVAIAVAREWKDHGIGWTLLRHALDLAFLRGLKTLRCIEDRSHREAIEVERALGFRERNVEGEPTLVLLEARVQ